MKWLDNKCPRHAVIYGALSSGPHSWHLSLPHVDFLLRQMLPGMLSWRTDASHPPSTIWAQHRIKTISLPGYKKYCKEAMSHGIRGAQRCQPLALIHYWHRDRERVPRNVIMTWAPYQMDYNQHNVWQYLTTIPRPSDENFIHIEAA